MIVQTQGMSVKVRQITNGYSELIINLPSGDSYSQQYEMDSWDVTDQNIEDFVNSVKLRDGIRLNTDTGN